MLSPSKPLSIGLVLAAVACASAGDPGPIPAPVTGQSSSAGAVGAGPSPISPAAVVADVGAAFFSDAQADRGRGTFRAVCTECHYSSELADAQFKSKWSRRSAGGLYQMIANEMPESAPGSLTDQEYVDLVSYILRLNGVAPGAIELAPDRTVLDGISLASIRDN
jgi:cytochrome c